jgi:hypothetical protein
MGTRGNQNDRPKTPLFCASKKRLHSAFDHIWGRLEYRGSRELARLDSNSSYLSGKSESTIKSHESRATWRFNDTTMEGVLLYEIVALCFDRSCQLVPAKSHFSTCLNSTLGTFLVKVR